METFMERFDRMVSPWAAPLTSTDFDSYLHISLQHKYIWFEIPKNACSSIKVALRRLEIGAPDMRTDNRGGIHNRRFSPLLRPSQVWNIDTALSSGKFTRFCFVRNPYSRTLSAYLDKIVRQRPLLGRILQNRKITESPFLKFFEDNDLSKRRDISFIEFLEAVAEQTSQERDHHWREQHVQCFYSAIDFDFIGRFENFEQDFITLGKRLHPDFASYYAVQCPHKTNAASLLEKYYTGPEIDLVRKIYAKDFELFDYSPDIADHI